MNEKAVASHILLDSAYRNITLWRNNSGGFYDETGRFVRYGLGGFEDKHCLKSSDFIGMTPVFVTPDMVGKVIGVFTAVETKPSDWRFSSRDKRSLYQKNFIDKVIAEGGLAGFATCVNDFREIINHEKD